MDPLPDLDTATKVIGALDSRLRMEIVLRLSDREHYVHELVVELGKSQPLISQHLRVLKKSGLVDSRRRGREMVYRLIQPVAPEIIELAAHTGVDRPGQLTTVTRIDVPAPPEEQIQRQAVAHTPAAAVAPDLEPQEPIPDPSPAPPKPQSPSDPG
ncbi:ArsR/SmtB family transcription factor [Corynebacterium halotolerans]|uniref:Cadmium efflux system accessory protein n=1 Tax=Corynebacterium halotolerans YIM 70093 = DSM 44683 TaxID=1121362 RepID=M1NP03_9CORY|nr:metalloregulator ArsR/SmtB family transcription factor [Corynebacterium halotolerans]AGF73073.1 cadmium efflux system accessory protein [Corynebacterium halotolerans YIM 70093 = DSM 44683]